MQSGIHKGLGGMGEGVYCVSLFKDSSKVNIFSLLSDYFDKHETAGLIIFTATDDCITHGDANSHHEGNSLCTREVRNTEIISASEVNENTLRTIILDTFICGHLHDKFTESYSRLYQRIFENKLSASYLTEKLVLGFTEQEVASSLKVVKNSSYIKSQESNYLFNNLTNSKFDLIVNDYLDDTNTLITQLRKFLITFYDAMNYEVEKLYLIRSSTIFNKR